MFLPWRPSSAVEFNNGYLDLFPLSAGGTLLSGFQFHGVLLVVVIVTMACVNAFLYKIPLTQGIEVLTSWWQFMDTLAILYIVQSSMHARTHARTHTHSHVASTHMQTWCEHTHIQ